MIGLNSLASTSRELVVFANMSSRLRTYSSRRTSPFALKNVILPMLFTSAQILPLLIFAEYSEISTQLREGFGSSDRAQHSCGISGIFDALTRRLSGPQGSMITRSAS